ncbi:hypothetical protein [Actinomycetospora cinnamomea]|uniref:Uncharacterized protein n=1 Tax=Actinomycetospora cinnamomea TaxID=663609 RepID=A0A2U1EWG0_9PSEU|nr:hypothetical protein [Actinomycetospora cinnamomea]PVZ04262.1 hypothetical protein C8D89_11850 [Actinomycetospora cinnamomea]
MAVPPRPAGAGFPATLAAVPSPRPALADPAAPAHAAAADAPSERDELAGVAWIVREVTHVPGVLRWREGRLSFESTRGVLFDGTPDELVLEVGRSSRVGLRVTVGPERLCVRVVRPAGGVAPCRELVRRAVDAGTVTEGDAASWDLWRPSLAAGSTAPARPRTRVRRAFGGFGVVAPS